MKLDFNKIISFSILLITVSSINQWTKLPIGNTFVWWGIYSGILLLFLIAKKKYYNPYDDRHIKILLLYLSWNIICIIRGIWVADNYWEWKSLVGTGMVLLLPLSIYVSTNKEIVQSIVSTWIKYALPAFFLFLPFFSAGDALGRYLVPFSFLMLFFPVLNKKWKIISLLFALFIVFGALDARSNVIKLGVSLVLSLLFYAKNYLSVKLFEFGRLFLLCVPIILFALAITGRFNVFKMDDYLGEHKTTVVSNGQAQEENLTADTRTGIYEEVLFSALKYDYIWLGRTPARGNESDLFGYILADELKTGKMERFSNEVSILNVFTWTGLVGVVLYFFVFYKASYLAIHKSKSIIMRIIGLFIAFRWTYAWIEDFSEFDLSYFFLWVMIGMCFSSSFRMMSDLDMKYWVLGLFDKRYRRVYLLHSSP